MLLRSQAARAVMWALFGMFGVVPGCGDSPETSDVEQPTAGTPTATAGAPAAEVSGDYSAEVLFNGFCLVETQVGPNADCRGLKESIECSRTQCGSSNACAGVCDEFMACLERTRRHEDQCLRTLTCFANNSLECQSCWQRVLACSQLDKCSGLYTCGSSEPGGSCSKLEACCNLQADPTPCLGWKESKRQFGGDPACQTLLDDPAFLKQYAPDPTCTP